MNEIRMDRHIDRLLRRRQQLVMTLQHIGKEQDQVEQNTDWLDQAAYESRVNLLDRLNDWYLEEMDQIDKAIARIRDRRYGVCAGCHEPIDDRRLETAPETEFCSSCQEMRENLEER